MPEPFDGPDRVASDLRVGEIRALRTFRLSLDGSLLPVNHGSVPWSDGPNAARCDHTDHMPAAPGCTCGFYAYGTRLAASQHAEASRVLAVVACWGRVVPGTLGLRAQHARIEALWLSCRIPRWRVARARRRYPSVAFYGSRRNMLGRHQPTRLDSYEIPPPLIRWPARLRLRVYVADSLGLLGRTLLRLLVGLYVVLVTAALVTGVILLIHRLLRLL